MKSMLATLGAKIKFTGSWFWSYFEYKAAELNNCRVLPMVIAHTR